MPAPAIAFPAGLLDAFDLAGTVAASGHRPAGPELADQQPGSHSDSFDDLLNFALAGASMSAATTQSTITIPVPQPEAPSIGSTTAEPADSPQRASLFASFNQVGRSASFTAPAFGSMSESTLGRETGDASIALDPAAGNNLGIAAADSGESPAFSAIAMPAAGDVETSSVSEIGDELTLASVPELDSALEPSIPEVSSVSEVVTSEIASSSSEANLALTPLPPQPVEFAAEPQVIPATHAGVLDQQAASTVSARNDVAHTGSEAAATDSTLSGDQSTEGLRPVSEFEQDVQTVPQPETPASSMPAAVAAESAAVSNEIIPSDITPVTASSEPQLPAVADASPGVREKSGVAVRSTRDVREKASDSSAIDAAASRDQLTEQSLDAAPGTHSGAGDYTPSDQNTGADGDSDSGLLTPLASPAANVAAAPPSEPAVSSSSVIHQVSSAIETWRDALQEQGTTRFSAWLNPPNLGHVYVELTRSADGITARLSASDDGVQSVLEAQGPELRQALNDAGITVAELDVSGRSAGDSGSQQQQPPPDQRDEPEAVIRQGESRPQRRAPHARSGAVDVRV